MGYKLDDKDVKFSRMTKIATGSKGDVYKYRNMALKVFRKDKSVPIDFYTADFLTNISTDRILLPKNLLFYNNTFVGYTYKLVPKKGSSQRIIMLPKTELMQNIMILERDIETLSNKKVLLDGIEPANSLFNGDLYLTDPSEYKVLDDCESEDLETINKCQLHMLLVSLIIAELRKNNFSSNVQDEVRDLLEMKDESTDSSVFFGDVINNNDSIKQFVKQMK